MKIKTKKQLNLPQLIEWGFENDITNKSYAGHDDRGNISEVYFNVAGLPKFTKEVNKSDIFPIEYEVEITEETKLDGLVELGDCGEGEDFFFSKGLSIKDCKDESTQSFYILNDDLTMTLIWTHDKGLVE